LAGIYTNTLGILTIPAFLALGVAILGSFSSILYFATERGNILTYFNCLRNKFHRTIKFQVHGADSSGGGSNGGGGRGSNGQAVALNFRTLVNGRYVINSESEQSESDSQGTTQHVDDLIYDPSHHPGNHTDHRLSVIPEHIEGDHHGGISRGSRGTGLPGLGLGGGGMANVEMASSSPAPGGLMTVPVYVHPQDSDVEVCPVL